MAKQLSVQNFLKTCDCLGREIVTEINILLSNFMSDFLHGFPHQNSPKLPVAVFQHCSHPWRESPNTFLLMSFCQKWVFLGGGKKKSALLYCSREHPVRSCVHHVHFFWYNYCDDAQLCVFLWKRFIRKWYSSKGKESHLKLTNIFQAVFLFDWHI